MTQNSQPNVKKWKPRHSRIFVLSAAIMTVFSAGARANDADILLFAPKLPSYKWFASTDLNKQNADYVLLKPGETRRVPLASGVLVRAWSTALEPDKITLTLQNGLARVELLRGGKARLGEFYQKAWTWYPTGSTPGAARFVGDTALVATNHSKKENKWFYQVAVRPLSKAKKTAPTAKSSPATAPKFDARVLDEKLKAPALRGLKLFQSSLNAKSPYGLCSAYGSARSQKGKPISILKVKGEGAFVGLLLDIRPAPGATRRTFAFLEGNETLIADGQKYEGTGTEDFFNSAWYFPDKPFLKPYHGLVFKSKNPPRVTAYRWMVADAVPFQKNFQFDLEHGTGNNSSDLEFRWVAFWIQKPAFDFQIEDALKASVVPSTPGASRSGGDAKKVAVWILAVLGGTACVWILFVARRKRGPSR